MNTTSITPHTAWVCTSVSLPTDDPGVTINRTENEGTYREKRIDVAEWSSTDVTWGQAPGDVNLLDEHAADQAVSALGWRRTSDWAANDGQWTALVESVS